MILSGLRRIYFTGTVIFLVLILSMMVGVASGTTDLPPLVYANNLVYKGAFKIPIGDDYSYGGSVIAFNKKNNSLFIVGHDRHQKVAEISIPEPVLSENLAALNRAITLQPLTDITEGNLQKIGVNGSSAIGNGVKIGGLIVNNNKLIGTSYAFYSSKAELSHFTSTLDFSITGDFSGMYAVGCPPEVPTASFVSGWLESIPGNLQNQLGGTVLTGNGSLSVLGRTSFGPAAFTFNPAQLSFSAPADAVPLLYYPESHQTLNADGFTNPIWNDTTKMAGMSLIEGSVLYFGFHGLGERNYGLYSVNPIYADECNQPDICKIGPKGWSICSDSSQCTTGRKGIPNDPQCHGSGWDGCYFDPSGMGSKGPHAYPYIYQVWAYAIEDLIKVKNGIMAPWDVMPYAVWELPFKFKPTSIFGGASAYDATTKRLYVAQPAGEKYGCCQILPVIHVFDVDMEAPVKSTYSVSGKVMLLEGTLELRNNDGPPIVVQSSDRAQLLDFVFSQGVVPGGRYNVSIVKQPENLSCRVLHGHGKVIANADVTNIVVSCARRQSPIKSKSD